MEEYDLIQCIDKALDGYGSSVKNAIFWRMTMFHKSSRNEATISDPAILSRVINEAFGSSAKGIEASIISEINKKFDLSARGVRSLVDAITEAKRQVITTLSPEPFPVAQTQIQRRNIFA